MDWYDCALTFENALKPSQIGKIISSFPQGLPLSSIKCLPLGSSNMGYVNDCAVIFSYMDITSQAYINMRGNLRITEHLSWVTALYFLPLNVDCYNVCFKLYFLTVNGRDGFVPVWGFQGMAIHHETHQINESCGSFILPEDMHTSRVFMTR